MQVGDIVTYQVSNPDALGAERARASSSARALGVDPGSGVLYGVPVKAGDRFPMIVTRVWHDNLINGQVFLDGNDTIWVSRRAQGVCDGEWQNPKRTSP